MPHQDGPSYEVKKMVLDRGGYFWTNTTDVAAGGTATAATTIEQPFVPDDARTLLGIRPLEYAADQAVAESLLSVFSLGSANYKYQPCEVFCGNVASSILATGGLLHAHSEYYDVFAPVKGGEKIDVLVEPIDAIAGNRRSVLEFTWANVKLPLPPIYSQCSREVALQTAGITAGTTLNISRTQRLIEAMGVFGPAAHTVEEEAMITAILKCTNWPIQEIKFQLEPSGAIADLTVDENSVLTYLARRAESMPFKSDTSVVTCDFDLDVAQTNAGQVAHGIRWI